MSLSPLDRSARDHCSTSSVSTNRRSISLIAGAISRSASKAPVPGPSTNNARSSCPSEMGRMRGSNSDAPPDASRKASPSARAARRVGSSNVICESSIGVGGLPPCRGRSPARIACAKLARNGRPTGTVKMPDVMPPALFIAPPAVCKDMFGGRQLGGSADVHPQTLHAYAISAAGQDSLVPHQVVGEGTIGRRCKGSRV